MALTALAICRAEASPHQDLAITTRPKLAINSLTVDNQPFQKTSEWHHGALSAELSPGWHRLQFSFSPLATGEDRPLRLLYQLQGIEPDWQEAGGEMRIAVIFYSTNSEIVGNASFLVHGDSEGWRGSVEHSQFSIHRERVAVPLRARLIQLKVTSGGPPETVGSIAVTDFKASLDAGTNSLRQNLWPYTKIALITHHNGIPDSPVGWSQGGFPSQMAKVLPLADGRLALSIVDDSRTGYAEWVSDIVDLRRGPRPGEVLELNWQELYTVGLDGAHAVDYSYVPPGEYTFRVKAESPLGTDLGQQASLTIVIPNFFWETTWFMILTSLLLAAALAYWVRRLTRRRLQFSLERLEHQHAIERERERIDRDIHDDLGANLAQIAMLSELAQTELNQPEQARQRLNKIFDTSTDLTRKLDETVWAINPAHDSLEDIVAFLGNFAQEHFRLAGIRCRFDMPEVLPAVTLTSAIRHNLFLAAKEALQNVAKHSGATEVWIRLEVRGEDLVFTIEDNGHGLPAGSTPSPALAGGGNGLLNMRRRIEEIGGRFEIEGQPGQGTIVRLILIGVLNSKTIESASLSEEISS